MLTGKGINRAGEGIIRAGYGSKKGFLVPPHLTLKYKIIIRMNLDLMQFVLEIIYLIK